MANDLQQREFVDANGKQLGIGDWIAEVEDALTVFGEILDLFIGERGNEKGKPVCKYRNMQQKYGNIGHCIATDVILHTPKGAAMFQDPLTGRDSKEYELTPQQRAMALEKHMLDLIEEMTGTVVTRNSEYYKWLENAKTKFQEGRMAFNRALAEKDHNSRENTDYKQ